MMDGYSFSLPTHIEFQYGALKKVSSFIKEVVPGTRIFLVTDSGILKAGIIDPIVYDLHHNGYKVKIFNRVQPNPKDVDCEQGGTEIRAFGADIVLAVGGGSVLDAAKVIAMLHTNDGCLVQYEGRNKVNKDTTPLIAIPTTAGTGSEVTRSAVITDTTRQFKMTVKDIRMAPKLAIVDPEVTSSLPPNITASTGMDAFVHAIEAYTCKVATPFSDAWAKEAMRYIFTSLRDIVKNGSKDLRHRMMLGSLMAVIAFSHADVAAVHCLAEALGGLYDTPHGIANSIFLPFVTEFNAVANPLKHAEVAKICGLPVEGLSNEEATGLLVAELRKLSEDIGIPSLKNIPNINVADFEFLAESSSINGSTPNNCREITKEDYLEILYKAY
jgi:alcohol dehydrogenase